MQRRNRFRPPDAGDDAIASCHGRMDDAHAERTTRPGHHDPLRHGRDMSKVLTDSLTFPEVEAHHDTPELRRALVKYSDRPAFPRPTRMPSVFAPCRALVSAVAGLALLLLAPTAASAQFDGLATNPSLGWQTIRTPNFRIHYEPGLKAWAEAVAGRIESVRSAVAARVGYTPPRVIDILIEDPVSQPNGSAWPGMGSPAMRFWATPPDPSSALGGARSWSEILSVHEYAHLAHMLRPSRNRWSNTNAWLSPVALGPVTIGSPAWVIEGYATVIEGELTGSGRPNGAFRPALLRQWALDGALPSYDTLDDASSFFGGSMRYLVGSAFLEWLQRQRGDSSLTWLWRRMTAKRTRTFNEAFTGTFGEPASVLYGRFVADVTVAAKAAETQLGAATRGTLRQRFAWNAGAPALSPDGGRVAVRLGAPGKPTQVVVFDTLAVRDSADSARVARDLREDSLDIPDYRVAPRGWKRVATLNPVAGVGFGAPRWMADGERLLVVRQQPLGDGRARPDLWMWHAKSGWKKQLTSGEGIREADPLPNGALAAGLSCGGGTCHLVLIDLVTGGVRRLATGAPDRPFAGVRVSPSGSRVASAVQQGDIWRPVLVDVASGEATMIGPDDGASRYAPTWAGDTALVVVSEASGVANLERIALTGPVTRLTRTTGSVFYPDVGKDGRVWFLDLQPRGYDLRTLAADAVAPEGTSVMLPGELAPAARRVDATKAVSFTDAGPRPARPYGLGPQGIAPMTYGGTAADGSSWGLAFNVTDPVGRVALLAQAGLGDRGMWRGGRLGLAYRGWRPEVQLQGWWAEHTPSRQRSLGGAALTPLDASYAGGLAALEVRQQSQHGESRSRVGGSIGQLDYADPQATGFARGARSLAFISLQSRYAWTPGGVAVVRTDTRVQVAIGSTNGTGWTREVYEVGGSVAPYTGVGLGVRGRYGVTNDAAPVWERFTYGGSPSPYHDFDMLSQRLVAPGVPFATQAGSRIATLTVETTGPLRLYHEWVSAGPTVGRFNRLLGAEVAATIPPLSVLRLPGIGVKAGVTYSTDLPWRRRTMGYAVVTLAP